MHGRRLATTDRLIILASPDSEGPLERIRGWADGRGIDVAVVEVGDDVHDVYDPNRPTLGITLGGDGTFLEGIKQFTPHGIPQLGINAGTLAFLARVELEDIEAALDEVIRGRATVDNRQKLTVEASGVDTTEMGLWDVLEAAEPNGVLDGVNAAIADHEREGARQSDRLPIADELPRECPVGVCSLNSESACRIALDRRAPSRSCSAMAALTPSRAPLGSAASSTSHRPISAVSTPRSRNTAAASRLAASQSTSRWRSVPSRS